MPGLYLHTGNRLEELGERLCDVLAVDPPPPMSAETVLVQSAGMQRWVSMQLAERLGVCANVEFPFPNRFFEQIFALFLERPATAADPFSPAILTFRIMRLLPAMLDDPDFEDLRVYLGTDAGGIRLYQLSRRLADLYDQYTYYRPDWVLAWQSGRLVRLSESHDEAWQRRLFMALVKDTDQPNRAELRRRFFENLGRRTTAPPGLPRRIAVFGISYLPAFHLEALSALRGFCDVNLFALNPCEELWDYITSRRESDRIAAHARAGHDDGLHVEEGNTLLASMGRHGRDFFRMIHDLEPTDTIAAVQPPACRTVLEQIQSDILTLANPDGRPIAVAPDDRSIRFMSCHSPMREIEVLRDSLLDLLDRDPHLSCRDILVMAPEIEPYVPLIRAVFDSPDRGCPLLPYSVADRTLRANRTVADFVAALELPTGRFRASSIMRLLESDAVQRRFELDTDDIATVRRWVDRLRIRWGIDGDARAADGLPARTENTWQAALDRLLLGYAMAESDTLFADILPSDQAGGASDTLDRFLTFFRSLVAHARELATPRPPTAWAAFLGHMLDSLFAFDDDSQREAQQVRAVVDELAQAADQGGFGTDMPCEVIRHILAERFERRAAEHGFLSHGITFCSMLPMRSIPFKVIYLLGMNDNEFPRRDARGSFDLMSHHPRPGDRARRLDDRYLFLESIVSARNALYVSFVGQALDDNSARPPSVCVTELRDYVKRRFACESDPPLSVTHRLQPYNRTYFTAANRELFSYSDDCRDSAALLAGRENRQRPAFITAPVAAPMPVSITLDELVRFFANPSRYFLEGTLNLQIPEFEAAEADAEAFELGGLDGYLVGELLADGITAGLTRDALHRIAHARGMLPHGAPGEIAFERLCDDVDVFASRLAAERARAAVKRVDIEIDVDGVRVSGRVQLGEDGRLVMGRYATVKAKDRFRCRLTQVLVCAGHTTRSQACLVGRGEKGVPRVFAYAPPAAPVEMLAAILRFVNDGCTAPLPFFPETSYAFARALADGRPLDNAYHDALAAWNGTNMRDGERGDRHCAVCFDGALPRGEDFERIAGAFYGPLIAAESEVAP